MIHLKGMAWDHERGYGPLLAVSEQFQRHHPDVTLTWDRRSLKDFGDYPVELLAKEYDIILIDHPHVGICSSQGVLVPLDEWIPSDFIAEQQANSVGLSHFSYHWGGHQWALAIDAAAQVASYRPDLLDHELLPRTWDQTLQLAKSLPSNRKMGWPLCPTDAMCSFLSLCANIGGKAFFNDQSGVSSMVGEEALELMFEFLPWLHESSLKSNPIQMYERMTRSNDIVYVPLAFGYSNYARSSYQGNRLRFVDPPSVTGVPEGALLGGVGIAVSAHSKNIPLAVEFAMFTASPSVQRTIYYEGGGQPGHAEAWKDTNINRDCNDFFLATWRTLSNSYMRPRNEAFPAFQEQAGVLIHDALSRRLAKERVTARETVTRLNQLYHQIKKDMKLKDFRYADT